MTSHSESLDAVIRNHRWSTDVSHDDFKMMMLGAALLDDIFDGNEDYSKRIDKGFVQLEAVLEHGRDGFPAPNLHQWEVRRDYYGLVCKKCGVKEVDCGATSESWICGDWNSWNPPAEAA